MHSNGWIALPNSGRRGACLSLGPQLQTIAWALALQPWGGLDQDDARKGNAPRDKNGDRRRGDVLATDVRLGWQSAACRARATDHPRTARGSLVGGRLFWPDSHSGAYRSTRIGRV